MDVLVGGPDSHGMPEKVDTFENLGDERRIGIRVGNTLMMLITDDETRYKAGDIIKLEVRARRPICLILRQETVSASSGKIYK